ncbi:MBL fold metallo-hydrolase [Aldersonia kunmingensis]|uniref:MBL fold metallo-hydrolase n=1 Tax=Aldersonia kunmingensis TaxID=408066 RepID=UPI00082B890E|nr:MBL fold metallo-hydrolase [Aldersonia kunmingensis]
MSEQHVVVEDTYTGHVSAGAAAQRRTVPGASIVKMSVGPMDNNAYLVKCDNTGKGLLIDAANDADRIEQLLSQELPGLDLIVTTHQHFDHWQALAQVAGSTGVPTAAHPLDAEPLPVRPDRLLAEGETVEIGDLRLEVIHLVGHTPGSVALALTDGDGHVHLFTGDCLFPGGVGKTWAPEDFVTLIDDVEQKVFGRFGDETAIYPGHGDDTTLGTERPKLAEWRERGW